MISPRKQQADFQKRGFDYKTGIFYLCCVFATLFGIFSLGTLLIYVVYDAHGWVDWQFITSVPSRFAEKAGVYPQIVGSSFVIALVAVFSLPLGVGAAIHLEEYSKENRLKRFIETNIANLAGVPSIVYGLLGLGIFVSTFGMSHGTVLLGALTLMLRVLPIVIVSSQEAIRAVPDSMRQASYGLGSTKWQTTRNAVLPEAVPGIMTGTILALANAMGETAPLIMIGVATSIFSAPSHPLSSFGALPLQIFAWSDYPARDFQHGVVPAAIVVLLAILFVLNLSAILVRNKFQKR